MSLDTTVHWCHSGNKVWLPSPTSSVQQGTDVIAPTVITVLLETYAFGSHFVEQPKETRWIAQRHGSSLDLVSTAQFNACLSWRDIALAYATGGASKLLFKPTAWKTLPEWRRLEIMKGLSGNITDNLPLKLRPLGPYLTYMWKQVISNWAPVLVAEGLSPDLDAKLCEWTWKPKLTIHLHPNGSSSADLGGQGSFIWSHKLKKNISTP